MALVSGHGPGSSRAAPSPDPGSRKVISTKTLLQVDLGRGHRRVPLGGWGPLGWGPLPGGGCGAQGLVGSSPAAGPSPQRAQLRPLFMAQQLPREPEPGTSGKLSLCRVPSSRRSRVGDILESTRAAPPLGNHHSCRPRESRPGYEQLPTGHLLDSLPFPSDTEGLQKRPPTPFSPLFPGQKPTPSVRDPLSDFLPFNLATWLN